MGFLSNAKHDVFVSYSLMDNEAPSGEVGWVDAFTERLSIWLRKQLGEKQVDVWRDARRLGGSDVLDDKIEDAVRNSGVMLSLLSPGYVRPDCYCMQEVEWFERAAKSGHPGLVVGTHHRVFPVLLHNIPYEERPEVFQGRTGFAFHCTELDETGVPLQPGSAEFQQEMIRLVADLRDALRKLREGGGQPATASPRTRREDEDGEKFRVFLASAPDDLKPTARRLGSALGREGIEVVHDLPPPYEQIEHAARMNEILTGADLSVHLLNEAPGEPIDDLPAPQTYPTYPVEQVRIAREDETPQLVLVPNEFDASLVEIEDYRKFLDELETSPRDADEFELVRSGRMLEEVLKKKRAIEEARQRAMSPPDVEGTAFVDVQLNDLGQCTDLLSYLGQRNMTPLMAPSADLEPTMLKFKDNLSAASMFILVFGSSPFDWVVNRLFDAYKLIAVQRLNVPIGVYVAPPDKQGKEIDFPFVAAVNRDSFDPANVVEPLLAQLSAAGAS